MEQWKKGEMEEVENGQRVKINIWIKYLDSIQLIKYFMKEN